MMSSSANCDLPKFDKPPVVETALSVQFETLAAMRSVHFGLFWQHVRDRFPLPEDRHALVPIIERDKEATPSLVQLRFETQENFSVQRLMLANNAQTEMMQIQNDRFIKNWRKTKDDDKYPHYNDYIKPAFEKDFGEFKKFIETEKLGVIKINQCEVTYVNHIIAGEGWESFDEFDKIFSFWKQSSESALLGRAADFGCRTRFPILGNKKEWIGWLHVDVQAALNIADARKMYAMTLTARGMYGAGYDFFDIGRRCIVSSFKNLTTAHMHKIWGIRS